MSFEEVLKKLIDKQKEETKIPIGKISPELLDEFHKAREFENDVDYEIELRKKQLEVEAEEKLYHEFHHKLKEVKRNFNKVWDKVYQEFGIEGQGNYSINKQTGIVSKVIEEGESPFGMDNPLQ